MTIISRLLMAVAGGASITVVGAAICAIYSVLDEIQIQTWIEVFLVGTIIVLVIDPGQRQRG